MKTALTPRDRAKKMKALSALKLKNKEAKDTLGMDKKEAKEFLKTECGLTDPTIDSLTITEWVTPRYGTFKECPKCKEAYLHKDMKGTVVNKDCPSCSKKEDKKVNEEITQKVNGVPAAEGFLKAKKIEWDSTTKDGNKNVWKKGNAIVAAYDPSWGTVRTGEDLLK